jgi:hypothetical protein
VGTMYVIYKPRTSGNEGTKRIREPALEVDRQISTFPSTILELFPIRALRVGRLGPTEVSHPA